MEYGIRGVILQPFYHNVLFHGELVHSESKKSLTGRLRDIYGNSSVEGLLDLNANEMSFDKTYMGKETSINYTFRKEGPLWVGNYKMKGKVAGSSFCELFRENNGSALEWEAHLHRFQMPPEDGEEWAKGFVQSMVDEGYFVEVKDLKTGEDLLLSANKEGSQN